MSFWVSEAEQKKIKKLVAKTGLSQREYLLSAALGRTIYQVEELNPTLFELKAIGRNINQLTMLAHQGRITTVNLTEATGACTIENAMTQAATKEDFIAIMESDGYCRKIEGQERCHFACVS